MKKATLTEAKNKLSALIDEVRAGETILVLDRGRPVARIESVLADARTAGVGRLERLVRAGLVSPPREPWDPAVLSTPPVRRRGGPSASELISEERASGR